ncbi:hypothetical protein BPAE_0049g00390 [Botrytis paeoniae]|uniref:Uncharacterized protein n=1 Tax=Botrytis paeoniae TaxID=278948 RepID=A0A4Z1FVI8_9HELO|nr:hypothetical protein BPAE_0049g00390 [Botrytis paeoniae]
MSDLNYPYPLPYFTAEKASRERLKLFIHSHPSELNLLTFRPKTETRNTLEQSFRFLMTSTTDYFKKLIPCADPEVFQLRVEKLAWSLMCKKQSLKTKAAVNICREPETDFPGIKPYTIHPTASQSVEDTKHWANISDYDCAKWKVMGAKSGNLARFSGSQKIRVPWSRFLNFNIHGSKIEDVFLCHSSAE